MKKVILIINIILIMSLFIGITEVYAGDGGVNTIISSMNGTSTMATDGNGIKSAINNVIGLIQVVGTGISLIVVTMLGIKYLLASPSEKADVKKQILPMLIGCVVLFGAVNVVAISADFSAVLDA